MSTYKGDELFGSKGKKNKHFKQAQAPWAVK